MQPETMLFLSKLLLLLVIGSLRYTDAWLSPTSCLPVNTLRRPTLSITRVRTSVSSSVDEKQSEKITTPEETTKKFGLEAGVFQSLKQNDGESAKSLLKRYGIAYLATSIPLALVSFALCYFLVDNGVDVASLLKKIGIENDAGEKAGTFALAYAAHKAASPIRFPPTVILTPVVAKMIGKEPIDESNDDDQQRNV
jgi:Protein of unknown function (DUF1279)